MILHQWARPAHIFCFTLREREGEKGRERERERERAIYSLRDLLFTAQKLCCRANRGHFFCHRSPQVIFIQGYDSSTCVPCVLCVQRASAGDSTEMMWMVTCFLSFSLSIGIWLNHTVIDLLHTYTQMQASTRVTFLFFHLVKPAKNIPSKSILGFTTMLQHLRRNVKTQISKCHKAWRCFWVFC